MDTTTDPDPVALRLPAHHVSERAVAYWRTTDIIGAIVEVVIAAVVLYFWRPWWAIAIAVALVAINTVWAIVVPPIRYRVHRWEVSGDAVHIRKGWISIEERIAPLSRVQTVDSSQGPLQRHFKLRTLTVTTASAAGPITIDCLDEDLARQLVADLTAITSATTDDAT